MAVAVTVGVMNGVVTAIGIVLVAVVGLTLTIRSVRHVLEGEGWNAEDGSMTQVGICIIQAATIRALSLTAGRDRTKQTEVATHATLASTHHREHQHAQPAPLASTRRLVPLAAARAPSPYVRRDFFKDRA